MRQLEAPAGRGLLPRSLMLNVEILGIKIRCLFYFMVLARSSVDEKKRRFGSRPFVRILAP